TQPWNFAGTKFLDHRRQTVVPTGRTLRPDSDCPEWKIKFVIDNEDAFRGDLVPPGNLGNGLTAAVHIGKRLEKYQCFIIPDRFQQLPLKAFAGGAVDILAQAIDNHKAGIVPGLGILRPRIAQSHNQVGRSTTVLLSGFLFRAEETT